MDSNNYKFCVSCEFVLEITHQNVVTQQLGGYVNIIWSISKQAQRLCSLMNRESMVTKMKAMQIPSCMGYLSRDSLLTATTVPAIFQKHRSTLSLQHNYLRIPPCYIVARQLYLTIPSEENHTYYIYEFAFLVKVPQTTQSSEDL